MASRLPALQQFARNLAARIGVISHCRYPLHTELLEDINNKIKINQADAVRLSGRGSFLLKIRAASPGIS